MKNYPNNKHDEVNLYGTISFVIMFIFVSIIVLLILYYSGVLSSKKEENPFIYTETDAGINDISSGDIVPQDAETTDEYAELLNFYLPSVEIINSDAPKHYLEELYPDTVLKETTDAGQEYIDNIIFLGDSITHGLQSYKMLKDGRETTQVWTPVSGTLTLSQANVINILYPETDTEITIEEAITLKKPPLLIVSLGVNGISFMNEDYFKSEYIKLIEMIQTTSPGTVIILQAMFPIARSYLHQNSISVEKITAGNEWIAAIAHETGTKFLNTYTALADEEGFLPEAYQNGDGMHFNEVGFGIELDYIRRHAYTR